MYECSKIKYIHQGVMAQVRIPNLLEGIILCPQNALERQLQIVSNTEERAMVNLLLWKGVWAKIFPEYIWKAIL